MSDKKRELDLKLAMKRMKDVGRVFRELYIGFEKDIIPHHYIGGFALIVAVSFWWSNCYLFKIFPIASKILVIVFMFSGYIVWAFLRVHHLNLFLQNLTETFESAGVKTATGKLPSFISDRDID